MVNIKTTKRLITGPTSWGECSVDVYQKLHKLWDKKDPLQLLTILYGIEPEVLASSYNTKLIAALEQASAFVYEEDFNKDASVPAVLLVNGKFVLVPTKVGSYSVGQAIQARRVMEEAGVIDTCLSTVTAIYLQPGITGKPFSFEAAKELEVHLLKLPVTELYPVGFFFFRQLNSYGNKLLNAWTLWRTLGTRRTLSLLRRRGLRCLHRWRT
jgi:hypothetical protein